ncbi:uncharacterized protein LOC114580339 [Dendrobium catenatum]|uniref:uncharacterized protein LOC114580339 n=1 Tax=Dendrobium catenatum TaxID=906689 RepID=UPI00109F6AF1|nr:uncharacterized protein LOC114580339 [Dendrobium catenatum]
MAKDLLNRMLGIIPKIISEEQAAFVKVRSISDNLLLAQEVFNKLRHSKANNGFLAIKVDMEQAYDSMCSETLKKMMVDLGLPFKFVNMVLEYDVLIFVEAKVGSMKKVKDIVEGHCKWTGQKINCHKSSLICGNSVERRRKVHISIFMGVKLVEEFEYLGIKMALRRLKKLDFQILLDKSSIKLNAWGNRYISLTGRLVMVKIVYLSLPFFIMSHSLIPMKTLMEFERLCRYFIWNKCDGKHGNHYVAWEQLRKPKQYAGWGVQSAVNRRDTLRANFAWKLLENPDSFLNRNLLAKYGVNLWDSAMSRGDFSSWKIISSGWNALKNFVRWKIGNGSKINVLKDIWILDKNLLKWPTFVGSFDDDNITLDFFIHEGNWDCAKLSLYFGA